MYTCFEVFLKDYFKVDIDRSKCLRHEDAKVAASITLNGENISLMLELDIIYRSICYLRRLAKICHFNCIELTL